MADTTATAPAATAAVKEASRDIVASVQWSSTTSILSAAFRIVPKIQEAAKDIPGQHRFDILVSVLEDGLAAWGDADPANQDAVAGLRSTLRDTLAPAVSAMINAVQSGDVTLGIQAGIGALVSVASSTEAIKAVKCGGWSCRRAVPVPAAPAAPVQ